MLSPSRDGDLGHPRSLPVKTVFLELGREGDRLFVSQGPL